LQSSISYFSVQLEADAITDEALLFAIVAVLIG
jgi:hypothetical protein